MMKASKYRQVSVGCEVVSVLLVAGARGCVTDRSFYGDHGGECLLSKTKQQQPTAAPAQLCAGRTDGVASTLVSPSGRETSVDSLTHNNTHHSHSRGATRSNAEQRGATPRGTPYLVPVAGSHPKPARGPRTQVQHATPQPTTNTPPSTSIECVVFFGKKEFSMRVGSLFWLAVDHYSYTLKS